MCIRDSVLRGIAAQHAREGEAMPTHMERRLDAGRAVCSLDENDDESVLAEQPQEGLEDARMACPDHGAWAHPD
eukprot:12444839-Alexandrium_andersonii.AAC.1